MADASADILKRNLASLAARSPEAAREIAESPPHPAVRFADTRDEVPSAVLDGRALASKHRPLDEARALAETIDLHRAACVVIMGFGLGYHVAEVARKIGRAGMLIVFEPDVPLLRSALERIDHSAWISATSLVLVTDPDDTGRLSAATKGAEGLLALGATFLDHPASAARLGDSARRFADRFTRVMKALRTTVATTLMHADVTLRNCLMNLDRYASCPGVTDLTGAARGRPAVVVSAGPSLRRNVGLLADPDVRTRVVVIAVQTVLKPLLAMGIRPDFVTALDYHEISRRFYEGLRPEDVAQVTLVVEPKANASILESYPGPIRCAGEPLLDAVLGPELARPMGRLTPGATVAHLAYYLARHLGCDPVILIGQDLGFTDGQYYAPGAPIHEVWACELNDFRTLEMFEWERIARMKNLLRRAEDPRGRPIYTDEQMSTYLVQFERSFKADAERGLTTIDATEGGVAKQHTRVMPLRDALEAHSRGEPVRLPPTGAAAPVPPHLAGRVRTIADQAGRIARISRRTAELLDEMRAHHHDQQRVNALIGRAHENRRRVTELEPAYGLTQFLNQTGALNRARADREISIDPSLDPMERQRLQIERDAKNVRWIADAAGLLAGMLGDTIGVLEGRRPRVTRDVSETQIRVTRRHRRIAAVIPVDPSRNGLGTHRALAEHFTDGCNPLMLTLVRLARCARVDRAVLLTQDARACAEIAGPAPAGLDVRIEQVQGSLLGERGPGIAAARRWAPACWRGGLAGLTCFDEVLALAHLRRVMRGDSLDAALLVGADWALVDPGLVDAVIDRYLESPDRHRVTFSQAPPGLCGCVVDRAVVEELAGRAAEAGPFATIGGLLGYTPIAPQADPIAKPNCTAIPAEIRNLLVRCIPDSETAVRTLRGALDGIEADPALVSATQLSEALRAHEPGAHAPGHLTIELCTGRRTGGERSLWAWGRRGPPERPPMPEQTARALCAELAAHRSDAAVTFAASGDPLLHPSWPGIVAEARRLGLGVHIHTDLLCESGDLDALLAADPDVISVNVMADRPESYRRIMGADALEKVQHNVMRLLEQRGRGGGVPRPWIVPRITRCDEVYGQIESFYNRWIMLAGAAVIDPLPREQPGERIGPMPEPRTVMHRDLAQTMTVLADGTVPVIPGDLLPHVGAGNVAQGGLIEVWRSLRQLRRDLDPGRTAPAALEPAHG